MTRELTTTQVLDPADAGAGTIQELREQVASRLGAYTRAREGAGLPPETAGQRRTLVETLIGEELEAHTGRRLNAGRPALAEDAEQQLRQQITDALCGLGPLQRLLDDERIENITANGCDNVWLRLADGRKLRGPSLAGSDEALVELIRQVAASGGLEERRFDRGSPLLNLQLPDGSRLFAVMAVAERISLSIRRHRFQKVTLDDLTGMQVCGQQLGRLLAALVAGRFNIMVAGGTNVGKTTVLRALCSEIPAGERLVTIEDTRELALGTDVAAHPDVIALQSRQANTEGEGAVDAAELVRAALRMAPDRVIVGEVRGSEVVPMCNAMSQGNDGSLSTLHASTSRGVFTKLGAYAAQSAERLSLEATNLLVASAVHMVVHLTWDREGHRVVGSVREVAGADGTQICSNELYRPGPDGRGVPYIPPSSEALERMERAGCDVEALLPIWSGRTL